jgi:hypothetical protein
MRMLDIVARSGAVIRRPISSFKEIVVVDFEYYTGDGTEPIWPHCMVFHELKSGRTGKYDRQQLLSITKPPFDIGNNTLYVGYALAAEMSCHLVLGWKRPCNMLDLFAEHRAETNGVIKPDRFRKNNMIVACQMRGISTIDPTRKKALQEMAAKRKDLTSEEMTELIEYCLSDVMTTVALLERMDGTIDLVPALQRGRYGWPVASIQATGVPMDAPHLTRLAHHWDDVRQLLVADLDVLGFYEGDEFRRKKCLQWMAENNIPCPIDPGSGQPTLDETALRDLAALYPVMRPLAHLHALMGQLRSINITIGADGMNRFAVLPFNTVTGRNSPSNSHCIFLASKWLRHFVQCPPGRVLIYFDWSSQEYVIAAALSDCPQLLEDCAPGIDPYIRFGQRARILPDGDTKYLKKLYPLERKRLKVTALATIYCGRAKSTAQRLGIPVWQAELMLANHARIYPELYEWQARYVSGGLACGLVWTPLRWPMAVNSSTKITTLYNFPCQSLGAEMMRWAAIRLIDAGHQICCPVHDAFLVVAPLEKATETIADVTEIMEDVALKLCGYPIKVDHQPLFPGQRLIDFEDDEDKAMRDRVLRLLRRVEAKPA